MSLSVCMMVKNEEKHLPRCLNSVQAFAPDEIIIVDTGSEDRTVEIAKSFGARVIIPEDLDQFFVHTGYGKKLNFAATRNYSFSFATSTWILQIDADETIQPHEEPADRFRLYLNKLGPNDNCVGFMMEDIRQDTPQRIKMTVPRVFRNGHVNFTGIVHNEAHWSGEASYYPFVRMYHYGYDVKGAAKKEKGERLLGLLEKRLEDDPDDHDAMFYLAQAAGVHGDEDKAILWGERYAKAYDHLNAEGKACYGAVHYLLAQLYIGRSDYDTALNWITKGLTHANGDLDLNYALMRLGLRTKSATHTTLGARNFVMAYENYERSAHKDAGRMVFNHNPGAYTLALYYATVSLLETTNTNFRKLTAMLPKVSDDLQEEITTALKDLFGQLAFQPRGGHLDGHHSNIILQPQSFRAQGNPGARRSGSRIII